MARPLPKTATETPLRTFLTTGWSHLEDDELADRLVDELDPVDVDRLADHLEMLAAVLRDAAEPEARVPANPHALEERRVGRVTYRSELVRCGKPTCKCTRGERHGPYWYAY